MKEETKRQLGTKLQSLYIKLCDNRGEFGIKQIAATLAVIVVIGCAAVIITGNGGPLSGWINWVWTKFTGLLDTYFT